MPKTNTQTDTPETEQQMTPERFEQLLREDKTMVRVQLPMLPDSEDGSHVDQAEYVLHADQNGGEPYRVPCGIPVDVPRAYFELLKIKHPNL